MIWNVISLHPVFIFFRKSVLLIFPRSINFFKIYFRISRWPDSISVLVLTMLSQIFFLSQKYQYSNQYCLTYYSFVLFFIIFLTSLKASFSLSLSLSLSLFFFLSFFSLVRGQALMSLASREITLEFLAVRISFKFNFCNDSVETF